MFCVVQNDFGLGFVIEIRECFAAGIVQALMMTKHMLFVGFSLQDDNFHRLFDSVQRARRPAAASGRSSSLSRSNRGLGPVTDKLGTVVCLEANTLQRELWGEHLDFVFMDGSVKVLLHDSFASRLGS